MPDDKDVRTEGVDEKVKDGDSRSGDKVDEVSSTQDENGESARDDGDDSQAGDKGAVPKEPEDGPVVSGVAVGARAYNPDNKSEWSYVDERMARFGRL